MEPASWHFGTNFAGAKVATAANATGVDKLATTVLRFGQGALHMMQGPGSLPSFLKKQSPQIQAMILEVGMSVLLVFVWFVCCVVLYVVCTTTKCSM